MSLIRVSTLLFGVGVGKSIAVCPAVKVGSSSSNPATFSASRPSATRAPSKMSSIAISLSNILTDPRFATAQIGDTVYYETPSLQMLVMDEHTIKATANPTGEDLITGMFCYALAKGDNIELNEVMKKIQKEYGEGNVTPTNLFLLCDNFYYHTAKATPTVTIEPVTAAEITAAARADAPQQIPALQEYGTTPSLIPTENAVEKTTGPVITNETVGQLLESAKAGDYLIDYNWSEEQKTYCQDISSLNGFVPNAAFASMLRKIKIRSDNILSRMKTLDMGIDSDRIKAIGMDYINVTFSGKPGTGKTRLAYALAAATGMPIYTISCSHNTDEDEFTGMTKMVDGRPSAVPTDTVRCFENGGILLLEEINLPQAAVVMGALGQAVEFPFVLKKDGYIPIRRHPLCMIVSTMNTGTAGSKVLSQPFANRFKQSFVLDDPSKEDFVRILRNTGAGNNVCRWVYDAYARIVACVENDNAIADVESILLSLSMRSCIGAIECIQEGMDPKSAIENSIIGKISEQDRTVAENCRKAVLNSLRNLMA